VIVPQAVLPRTAGRLRHGSETPSGPVVFEAYRSRQFASRSRFRTPEGAGDYQGRGGSCGTALRSSPRRLARSKGEPLKRRENSSCVIVIHSVSDGPPRPSRARNASSGVSDANPFQGQTSWVLCRLNRFRIELTTGRNTEG
jgi:hypothetical protein